MYQMRNFGEKKFSMTVKNDVISHATFENLEKYSPPQNFLETQYLPFSIEETKISKFVQWLEKKPCL